MQGPRWVRGPLLAVLGVTPLLTAGAQGAERDKDKLVFGTLHGHSSWSIDAYGLGNRSGPDKAYRFARGEEVDDTSGNAVKLKLPPGPGILVGDLHAAGGLAIFQRQQVHHLTGMTFVALCIRGEFLKRVTARLIERQWTNSGRNLPDDFHRYSRIRRNVSQTRKRKSKRKSKKRNRL